MGLDDCRRALACALLSVLPLVGLADADHFLGNAYYSDRNTPKLIVILHGGTPAKTDKPAPLVPEPTGGTLDYTRFYFGFDFVRRLMGVGSAVGLKTMSGFELDNASWSAHGPADADGKVVYTIGCDENKLDDHFIVPGNFVGTGIPKISAFLSHRDGSKELIPQTKAAINQIYDAYVAKFGKPKSIIEAKSRPNIILVGHSFGNLVSRMILCAPSDPIQGAALTPEERAKAEALRDKTLCFISLAGPHEGSPLATRAGELVQFINSMPHEMNDGVKLITGGKVKELFGFIKSSLDTGENRSLTTAFWSQLNTGVLAPARAARGNNTLVPIYTLIGNSPGGDFWTDPTNNDQFPSGGIMPSLGGNEDERRNAFRSLELMLVDYMLHNVPGSVKTWGKNPLPGDDLMARYQRNDLGLTLSKPGEDDGIPFGLPKFFSRDHVTKTETDLFGKKKTVVVRTNRDGEVDSDGLVSVSSGHGRHLGTAIDNFFSNDGEWDIPGVGKEHGSWYRLPSEGMPWEWQNHERIHRRGTVGNWLFHNIVQQAGPLVGPGDVSLWPEIDFDQIAKSEELFRRLKLSAGLIKADRAKIKLLPKFIHPPD